MPKFSYTARDNKGGRIEGALEVDDRQAVVMRLQAMGYFPVKIVDISPKGGLRNFTFSRGKVKNADLVAFNRQLADLVAAGVPLVRSLTIILEQTQSPVLRQMISEISKSVSGGDTLAQALQHQTKNFPPFTVAMVRAGESGGMLADVLMRLAGFAEAEEELKGKVISSLAYPGIMCCAGLVVITILIKVVIPKIVGVYGELGQTLPGITQVLLTVSNLFNDYWWIVVAGVFGAVVALKQFLKTTEGRTMRDRLILVVPLIGTVVHKREISRFARTLGNLIQNGVPILTALDITQEVMSNIIIKREIQKLPTAISQGSTMAATLAESSVFPSIMTSMIAVGEETAQLDKVLLRVSETYENQVDRSLKTLTSMLEPLIILALGLVVGFIVISMLLPIMTLDPTGGQ